MNLGIGYQLSEGEGRAVVLRTPLIEAPGLVHGFATRRGGVSSGTFSSLNLGLKGGDDPAKVRTNLERLGQAVGFGADGLCRVRQVHGRGVVVIGEGVTPSQVGALEADALVTDRRGLTLGMATADCVPVLFADPVSGVVAAAHAGWRGVVGGVLEATVETMVQRFGVDPRELRAAMGPCIGPCCFEVGEEVAAQFARFPKTVLRGMRPKPMVDLPAAVLQVLRGCGLAEANLAESGLCTRCHPELLFSYRRDGEATGHHLSVIGLC